MIRKNIPYIVEGIFEKHINKYKKWKTKLS